MLLAQRYYRITAHGVYARVYAYIVHGAHAVIVGIALGGQCRSPHNATSCVTTCVGTRPLRCSRSIPRVSNAVEQRVFRTKSETSSRRARHGRTRFADDLSSDGLSSSGKRPKPTVLKSKPLMRRVTDWCGKRSSSLLRLLKTSVFHLISLLTNKRYLCRFQRTSLIYSFCVSLKTEHFLSSMIFFFLLDISTECLSL